jgi:hypothetical protein
MGIPFVKVSNKRAQYVDYSKERRNQMRDRIRFWKWSTVSGQVELENNLFAFIAKSMDFSQ